ncbi:hypothetical protein NAC44_08350 [Allorhizobium sp. BGMRC 0089]|uniref:hypothetical protein n=1 Tax=Allorhizobium sonneratiae TaxID=2934936 RepID=UPI0020337D8D|nr:hypothetical protein [Allorhizobium sonneratiae]MCM2292338.1 hypothetical protein [Allorhizobium sonneratiae]
MNVAKNEEEQTELLATESCHRAALVTTGLFLRSAWHGSRHRLASALFSDIHNPAGGEAVYGAQRSL